MNNIIGDLGITNPQKLQQKNNNLAQTPAGQSPPGNQAVTRGDSVTLNQKSNVPMTYSSSLTTQSGDPQDQYGLLRELVTNMLKEQGIDFKIAAGDQEIDLSTVTREEAVELIAYDGYFGVEQTSDRIFEFAISVAGGDPSRLDAIKEGVEKGFNDALEAFGGWLPEISHETLDAVMSKLDAWAEADSPQQES